jgi:tetratricopeptide (TPR) repeat protein
MDWKENPQSHRSHFYLGRRLCYNDQWKAAIRIFEKGLFETKGWCTEMSQAAVYCGICYVNLGHLETARNYYLLALDYDASRREPWLRLAYIAQAKQKWSQMRGYLAGMMATPCNIQLYESESNYGMLPKELMYLALVKLKDYEAAFPYWQECRIALPNHLIYQQDAHYFKPFFKKTESETPKSP